MRKHVAVLPKIPNPYLSGHEAAVFVRLAAHASDIGVT
jgi:hypothetical protein